MSTRNSNKLVPLLMLICASLAHADLNSRQRVRAFAKLPDWSGLWEQLNIDASGHFAIPGSGSKDQILFEESTRPPYNAEWQAEYQERMAKTVNEAAKPICAFGFPQIMVMSPLMFQAVVTPEETVLIFSQRETRHIYTDGRAHTSTDELWATPWGESVGRWEGETLVVDTIATSSPVIKTAPGPPRLSDKARFVERIRMLNRNTLEDRITIEDPVALIRPWRLTRQYHRVLSMNRIIDEDCEGNERNPVVNGKFTVARP